MGSVQIELSDIRTYLWKYLTKIAYHGLSFANYLDKFAC